MATTMPLQNLSKKQLNYISLCLQEAICSEQQFRHGCVLVKGGKVLGRGHNTPRSRVKNIRNICSVHAECACALAALRSTLKLHTRRKYYPQHCFKFH